MVIYSAFNKVSCHAFQLWKAFVDLMETYIKSAELILFWHCLIIWKLQYKSLLWSNGELFAKGHFLAFRTLGTPSVVAPLWHKKTEIRLANNPSTFLNAISHKLQIYPLDLAYTLDTMYLFNPELQKTKINDKINPERKLVVLASRRGFFSTLLRKILISDTIHPLITLRTKITGSNPACCPTRWTSFLTHQSLDIKSFHRHRP